MVGRMNHNRPVINISTIAQELKTTASTVSRALNGQSGVSRKRAEEIIAYAAQRGYRPSPYTGKRSNCLAMLFDDNPESSSDTHFQSRLIYAAERYASKLGKFLFISSIDSRHNRLPDLLREHRIDGVLLASFPPVSLVEMIRRYELPMVALEDLTLRLSCDCAITNPQAGSAELIRRLVAAGHRRFAFVITNRHFPSVDRRFQVMEYGLQAVGLLPPPAYILNDTPSSINGGIEAVKRLLALPERPDAIIFTNDLLAIGGMTELNRAGVAVPREISVAAFDNSEFCEMTTPPLTSVELHTEALVHAAVDRLLDLADSDHVPDRYAQIEIKSALVWRQSCRG